MSESPGPRHPAVNEPVTLAWFESIGQGTAAATHFYGTVQRLKHLGIPITRVIAEEQSRRGGFHSACRLVKVLWKLRRTRPNGILVCRWHPLLSFATPRWRRKHGHVVLLVQGNADSSYESRPWLRRVPGHTWLMRTGLLAADATLVPNRGLQEWLHQVHAHSPDPTRRAPEILTTGVADRFFAAKALERTQQPYALFVGNLAPWQGIDLLLAAAAHPAWPQHVRLLIAGSGHMADYVAARQDDQVQWLGHVAPEQVAPLVAGAVCTICPKRDSGSMGDATSPFKIFESVAAGVPVVATDIPAQRRLIEEGGYGLLSPLDSPPQLAQAVARIASDPSLRTRLVAAAESFAPRLRWEHEAHVLLTALLDVTSTV